MACQLKPWWNERKGAWCSDIGGKRQTLAKGKRNKRKAEEKLKVLLAEQDLLADVNGSVTVARPLGSYELDTPYLRSEDDKFADGTYVYEDDVIG